MMVSGGASRTVEPVGVLDQHPPGQQRLATGRGRCPTRGRRRPRPTGRGRGRRPAARRRPSRASRACRCVAERAGAGLGSPVSSRSITARPTAQASGLPPNVEPCVPGVSTPSTSARPTTAETGTIPPPSALPSVTRSGRTPVALARERRAGAPEPGLDLVEDQQRAGGVAQSRAPRPGSRPAARRRRPRPGSGSSSTATVSSSTAARQRRGVAVGHHAEARRVRAEAAPRVLVGGEARRWSWSGRGSCPRRRRSSRGPRARP